MSVRDRMVRAALFSLLAVTSSGCDGLGPGLPLLEVEENRARWESTRPIDYRYAVRRSCFCGGPALGPVRMLVEGDEVVERVYVEDGQPVPLAYQNAFPTVDGLFDVILDAIERDAHRLEVTYDAATGVPLEIDIDYEEFTDDEELGFRVTEQVSPLS